jgi:sigma-B regulation protein RsbU (phosphoserine phosphatase)
MPIGLVEGASYGQVTCRLQPGDRLILISDGMTECPAPDGQELGGEGLTALLVANATLPSAELVEALGWD